MADKISKTARASMAGKRNEEKKMCTECRTGVLVATKVIRTKYSDTPGGMFWVCSNCDQRIKCQD